MKRGHRDPLPADSDASVGVLDSARQPWRGGAAVAALLFDRALLHSGDMAVIDALATALAGEGLNVLPVHLVGATPAAVVEAFLAASPPDVVVNTTEVVLAVGPVLQVGLADGEAAPPVSGLTGALPIAALPQMHGHIPAGSITGDDVAPDPERIAFVASLAARWAALRRKAPDERRLTLVVEQGIDVDRASSAVAVLKALAATGHCVDDLPDDGEQLLVRLGRAHAQEAFLLPDYYAWFHSLPAALRDSVGSHWGGPERDRLFHKGELHCGEFAVSALRFGSVTIGVLPAGDASAPAPRHGHLALYGWLQDGFRADAVVHIGLSHHQEHWIGQALGPMPHFQA